MPLKLVDFRCYKTRAHIFLSPSCQYHYAFTNMPISISLPIRHKARPSVAVELYIERPRREQENHGASSGGIRRNPAESVGSRRQVSGGGKHAQTHRRRVSNLSAVSLSSSNSRTNAGVRSKCLILTWMRLSRLACPSAEPEVNRPLCLRMRCAANRECTGIAYPEYICPAMQVLSMGRNLGRDR